MCIVVDTAQRIVHSLHLPLEGDCTRDQASMDCRDRMIVFLTRYETHLHPGRQHQSWQSIGHTFLPHPGGNDEDSIYVCWTAWRVWRFGLQGLDIMCYPDTFSEQSVGLRSPSELNSFRRWIALSILRNELTLTSDFESNSDTIPPEASRQFNPSDDDNACPICQEDFPDNPDFVCYNSRCNHRLCKQCCIDLQESRVWPQRGDVIVRVGICPCCRKYDVWRLRSTREAVPATRVYGLRREFLESEFGQRRRYVVTSVTDRVTWNNLVAQLLPDQCERNGKQLVLEDWQVPEPGTVPNHPVLIE